ncbi:gliding motility protein GldN [Urechidicola vernalis]|uniref:Gliding motility protein GldN n=1 Tax=Urechidicola vernalis TaxID=3075600 RepID=A0ABU2Y508_9FLAO|nr:gliding motility protein GldN [Urechidicola sp. P050]MDT0553279.1 gliding motility protein GldN [Urechidicola sp. P050]
MNRKSLILGFVGVFSMFVVKAQSNLLNATTPDQVGVKTAQQLAADNDKPMEYGYVDDRDMMWSKVVWEYIDLNERINLPFYYPIHENSTSKNRKSLFKTLLDGIMDDQITEVYDDTYFTSKLTKKEIEAKLFRIDTTDAGKRALNQGESNIEEFINRTEINPGDIEGFKIKGVWYIDKRQGEMKYRLLAIAPVAPDVQTKNRSDVQTVDEKLALFWVWYPGARQNLYDMKVFNQKNSAYPISYDHLLNAKRFNAIIYREENLYGNRDVSHYVRGNSLFQVLESDKIRENIRDKELDIWNY